MKVVLLGAGAVGLYFCGRLAQSGVEVTVVARSDYEQASRRGGYDISSLGENFRFVPARLLRDAADCSETADYVIMATKVLPEVDRIGMLRQAVKSPRTVIVLIQNGIDIEREIAEAFPANQLISTIAYIGASRPEPGKVLNAGSGNLKMGCYPQGVSPEAEALAAAFNASKVPCELYGDIVRIRWEKLLWNLPFNPVSVLAGGADTRLMSSDPDLLRLCSELMDEVIAVAVACGTRLTRADADHQIAYTKGFPPYKTSMLQDYLAGRRLEVDAILGNALRLAETHDIPVPRMRACYALLKAVDAANPRRR